MDAVLHSPIWIYTGKILLALIMFAFGAIAILIFLKRTQWKTQLEALEVECDEVRDMVMLQGTVVRYQLHEFKEKLNKKPEQVSEVEIVTKIVRQAMPLLSLLVKKETSLVQWGFAGTKLVKTIFDFFSDRKK